MRQTWAVLVPVYDMVRVVRRSRVFSVTVSAQCQSLPSDEAARSSVPLVLGEPYASLAVKPVIEALTKTSNVREALSARPGKVQVVVESAVTAPTVCPWNPAVGSPAEL
jgi:hypothetical protein